VDLYTIRTIVDKINLTGSIREWFEKREGTIAPWLVYGVGLALLAETVWELKYNVLNYDQYQFMFHWMAASTIYVRYCISVTFRCMLMGVALGVLLRMEFFRRALIWLMWLSVLIMYWKHPYQAVVNANLYDHTNASYFIYTVRFPWAPQVVVYPGFILMTLQMYLLDLLKATVVIGVLSHPSVRRLFK